MGTQTRKLRNFDSRLAASGIRIKEEKETI
jgi:hypothetical protein